MVQNITTLLCLFTYVVLRLTKLKNFRRFQKIPKDGNITDTILEIKMTKFKKKCILASSKIQGSVF